MLAEEDITRNSCESATLPTGKIGPDTFEKVLLALLIVAFTSLSALYSFMLPIFEPQDEEAHFQFMKHLAARMSLPDFRETSEIESAGAQSIQTPLYYCVLGLLLRVSGNSNIQLSYQDNPFRSSGTPAFFYHNQPGEKFPYEGKYRVIHLLRLINVIAGALTLLVIYNIAKDLPFRSGHLAIGATSFVALIPQFTYLCASLNNDVFSILFASFAFFFLMEFLLDPHSSTRLVSLLSVSLGLSILSKQMALSLIPICYLAVLFKGEPKKRIRNVLTMTAVLLALVGWYYARNWLLFGDIFNLKVQIDGALPPVLGQKKSFMHFYYYFFNFFIQLFVKSFWGSFGYMTVWMTWTTYLFYDVIAGFGLLSFGLGMLDPHFRSRFSKAQVAGLLLIIVAVIPLMAEILSFNLSLSQPQGRYAFLWLCGLAMLWGLGIDRVTDMADGREKCLSLFLISLFALVNLHVLGSTVRSAFPPMPSVVDVVQNQFQTTMGELHNPTVIGQSFHCNIENLDQVAVRFTTFGRYNNCHIIFHLRDSSDPTKDLVTISLPAVRMKNDTFHVFKFKPLDHSKGRNYFLMIASPDGREGCSVGCYYTFLNSYSIGTAFVDDRPLPGDLAFITGRS